jgi:Tfp pilus assembly protein PilV
MAIEATGKVATSAIEAMKSTPLAIALLVVNVGFLGFAAFVLGEVASNASDRNKTQMELITKLVGDIRDCRQGPKSELFHYFDRAGERL